MGESSDHTAPAAPAGSLARRQFLLKAAVAGTAVWVAPSIIAIQPAAAADLNSRPPKHVDRPHVDPVVKPPAAVADQQLPFTGDDNDDLIVAGLAATAAGASLLFLTNAGAHVRLEGALVEDS